MKETLDATPARMDFEDLVAQGLGRLASIYEQIFNSKREPGRKRRWAFFE